ncbi:hypothetical protein [Sinomonas sp. P10A9]|uniref:Uncharacterized protein n=1 Tax=Sinomonas puerhi TaxID=3238584 RepID=A0AB39L832_9MICC
MSPATTPARTLGVLALAGALCLGGCSVTAAPKQASNPPASTSPSSASLPLAAAVDQFRDGYASGTIVLQLTDTGGAPFTVVRAELDDPRFAGGTVWTGSTDFTTGQTTSLPAVAAAPRCSGPGGTASAGIADPSPDGAPSVVVRLADGTGARVAATDPHGVLARIHTEGCFAAAVASVAALRLDDELTPGPTNGTAVLTLRVEPIPVATPPHSVSALTLSSVGGTTLLDEDPAQPWPRGVVLAPGKTVRLAVRPARCDPHAVAEDKVGTLVPLTVAMGGASGVVKVAAATALRAAIYAFVASACGWSAG